MQDQKIIELFWQRSEEAVSAVTMVYGSMCHGIAWGILKNEEDTQECVNDTWHTLWITIPPPRPNRLKAYIARITRNLAMKRLTLQGAAKRQAVVVSFDELSQCIPDQRTVENTLEGKELSQAIDRFLDTLDQQDRNLFLRRYWFFDSVKELSQRFHMTQNHVKVKLHRMREQLKDYLAKEVDIHVR